MSRSTPAGNESVARLADLARQTLRTQAGLVKQSVELSRATLSGDLDRAGAGRAYVEAVSREGARYWRAVGELGIDYASDLLALGNRMAADVLGDTARASAPPQHRTAGPGSDHGAASRTSPASRTPSAGPGEPGGTTPPGESGDEPGRRVALVLRGPLGGRAAGAVTVSNRHPRARRVQLSAGDLTDAGGRVVGARLEIEPVRVTVPAGQERAVAVGVELSVEHVSAGGHYSGTVEVSGGDEATLDVTVEVAG